MLQHYFLYITFSALISVEIDEIILVVGNFDLSMNIVFVYDLSTDFLMHFPFRISQCFPFYVGRMDVNIMLIYMAAVRTKLQLQHIL